MHGQPYPQASRLEQTKLPNPQVACLLQVSRDSFRTTDLNCWCAWLALQEPSRIEKVAEVDTHIGVAMSGLTADARTLIEHARVETQVPWLSLHKPSCCMACTSSQPHRRSCSELPQHSVMCAAQVTASAVQVAMHGCHTVCIA